MTHPLTPREKVLKAIIDVMKPKDADITLGRVDTCTDAILTALASGSGDHAELARLAEEAEHDPEYDGRSFEAAANPATVLALLAEIAALRAQSDFYKRDNDVLMKNAWVSRATEAERALSEHRITADLLVSTLKADKAEAERKMAEAVGLKHLTDDQIFAAINAAVTITRDRNGVDNGAVCISPVKFRTFLNKEAERG